MPKTTTPKMTVVSTSNFNPLFSKPMKRPFHLSDSGKNAKLMLVSPPRQTAPTIKTNSIGDPIVAQQFICESNMPTVEAYDPEALLQLDQEINLTTLGQFTENASKAFLDSKGEVVGNFQQVAVKYDPSGEETSRKVLQGKAAANINHEVNAVEVLKEAPYKSFVRKYSIRRTYQLAHTDGVSFSFLYDLCKRLHDNKTVAILGYGPKKAPLIFQDGGTPYRCVLYGQIQGDTYKLLVLISGQELKLPN
jgi:hypothetical protein